MPGARGEGFIKLPGGEERPILFTNRALVDVERLTGKSVMQLLQTAQTSVTSMTDTAILLQIGMEYARREGKTGGKAFTSLDAYDVLDTVGFGTCARVVLEALADVLAYAPAEETEIPPG